MRGMQAICAAGVLALGVTACGGGERQDKNEPSGTYKLQVVSASFPAKQSIADASVLRIQVRNADTKVVPNIAVTVQTEAQQRGDAEQAFGQNVADPNLANPDRPIWIVDKGPVGGDTAYTNTWALGPLGPGKTATFEWHVTAVKAGSYKIDYSVFPGLNGKARPDGSGGQGSFTVKIDDTPPAASVGDNGQVIRSK